MGLDMYLSKKTYVKNWSFQTPEETHEVTVLKGGQPVSHIKPERVSFIVEEVAYWRKFNALHGWFVNNCANGVDDCKEVYVDSDQLKELVDTLKKVKEIFDNPEMDQSEIEDLLPPTEGFFFGNSDIDEYYKQDVIDTIDVLEGLLEEEGQHDFYYRASW